MKKLLIILAASIAIICGAIGIAACADKEEYSVACITCDNGYVTVSDTKAEAGEKVIIAAHPDAGYMLTTFLLDGEELEGCSFIMPEKDVTVSAQFEVVTYSITYVLGDATFNGSNPETYTVNSDVTLTDPKKDGYDVCGWYTYYVNPEYYYDWDMEYCRVKNLKGFYGNLTLYAKYYKAPHTIHVEENDNGECWIEDYYGEAFYGDTYNITVDPDEGYELDYITVNGEKIEGTSFTIQNENIEIAANFKLIVYDIIYELFGGENAEDNPDTYTVKDEYIYLSNPTKEGFVFTGWYLDAEMTKPVYNDYFSVYDYLDLDGPLTLYASFISEDEE
ncbi:MAG: InlB B-repeat-containing protein [Clostridia bacterium]|nr:InlB B-repeat-containing protein [Clostridia bacterium]